MIDIVERLRFDEIRCDTQFSKGVAGNIREAAEEIERLREIEDRLGLAAIGLQEENKRLRDALKDIQAEAMTLKPPRHSWYYDRAQNALTNSDTPLVRDGLAPRS